MFYLRSPSSYSGPSPTIRGFMTLEPQLNVRRWMEETLAPLKIPKGLQFPGSEAVWGLVFRCKISSTHNRRILVEAPQDAGKHIQYQGGAAGVSSFCSWMIIGLYKKHISQTLKL